MIYVEDDFLPEKEFFALRELILRRYNSVKHKEKTLKNPDSYESIRLTYHDPKGNYKEGSRFLGDASWPAIDKLIKTFEKLNIPAESYSLWFAYMFSGMRFIPHIDGELRQSNREHTYTCMYYTSDWQPGWGGELIFGEMIVKDGEFIGVTPDTIVEPKPNRQVIFSREHPHEVSRIVNPDSEYIRCALGSGWSSVKDRESYRNVKKT